MNKFWVVLLKIIIVISILGIVIFTGIVIFKNQNIAYEAYNYIATTRDNTDFDSLQTNINNNVKNVYGGSGDQYAQFINSGITQLNNGIDYFLDYLVHEDKLSKGEQDKLISLYDNYISGINTTHSRYNTYMQAYNNAKKQIEDNYEEADYAIANVKAKGANLVKAYVDCYNNGSKFFKYLAEVVNIHTLNNTHKYSYTAQSYMIKVGMLDYSMDFVVQNMNKKINDLAYTENIKDNELVNNYYLYLANEDKFADAESVTVTSLRQYLNNLNCLNTYEWAGNYNNYLNTLSENLKQKATSAKSFYDIYYK